MAKYPDRAQTAITDLAYLLLNADLSSADVAYELEKQHPGLFPTQYAQAIDTAQQQILSEAGLGEIEPLAQPPVQPGTLPQWEAEVLVVTPTGMTQSQYIRVDREPGDTDQDVRDKLLLARIEIETIIAERGGDYEVSAEIADYYPV